MNADRPLGLVLAGGLSRRFGSPKALERWEGERWVDRVAGALIACDLEVLVAGAGRFGPDGERWALPAGTRAVSDAQADAGPLSGICGGLLEARISGAPGVIAVACDLPFVTSELLGLILAEARAAGWPEVVAPAAGGPHDVEPLCAFYATTALPGIEHRLVGTDRSVMGAVGALACHSFVPELRGGQAALRRALLNANRPQDVPENARGNPPE